MLYIALHNSEEKVINIVCFTAWIVVFFVADVTLIFSCSM